MCEADLERVLFPIGEAVHGVAAGMVVWKAFGQDDAAAASAEGILEKELREYLKGIELTFPNLSYAGVGDLGGVL